jgi:histidyl-tRNA synthetase
MRSRNCARSPPTPSSTSPRDRPVREPRRLHGRARHRHQQTRFSTSFGRGLDYYTGFEFELHAKGNGVEPLVAGGRYDGLMTQLGSRDADPRGRLLGLGRT